MAYGEGEVLRLVSAKSKICVLFMNTRKMVIFGTIFALYFFVRRCSEG